MKTTRFILIIVAIIVILPLLGRLLWEIKKSRPINLLIINKTVPKSSENELRTLDWTLNFEKFVKPNNDNYNYKTDYYGFHPDMSMNELMIKSFRLDEIDSFTQIYNGLIFIDNSGVEIEEKGNPGKKMRYGGLNQNDYILLKGMIAQNKLVFAEYNFFSEPTVDLVRFNTEKLIDIYYLGWKGKYFNNLKYKSVEKEISSRWIDIYKKLEGKDWTFNGPGIILMNEAQSRIIVVPSSIYMKSEYPALRTSEEQSKVYNLPSSVAFTGWFSVVYRGKNTVISDFDLNLNKKGVELLYNNGLEPVFPAVIVSPDKRFFFVAGDFSKTNVLMAGCKLGIITSLWMNIAAKMTKNPNKFFQTYYNSLLSSILDEYYSEVIKQ